MKEGRWRRATVLVAVCAVVSIGLGDGLFAQKPTRTISGKVKQAEVYRGKTRAVYLDDGKGGAFLIVRTTDVGKELLERVGSTVTATGYVRKARPEAEFDHVFDVLRYEVEPSDASGAGDEPEEPEEPEDAGGPSEPEARIGS